MRYLLALVLFATLTTTGSARAQVRIFACEPEWAALATAIGGSRVAAFAATHADQDPHHIRARPSLIARIRGADLLFCSGGGLEIGWLPILLQRGAPAKIQPGQPGYLMAADHVAVLEKPVVIDRALGDIHPEGNPHVHLDPRNIESIAAELARRLIEIDPANAPHYRNGLKAFTDQWQRALERWRPRVERLRGHAVIVHHKSWSYLIRWLGLVEVGTLESKPGIAPNPSHLASLLNVARARPIRAILRTPFDSPAASEWLSIRTGIPLRVVPFTVADPSSPGALEAFFDLVLKILESQNDAPGAH